MSRSRDAPWDRMALALQVGYYLSGKIAQPVSAALSQVAAGSSRFTRVCVTLARAIDAREQRTRLGGLFTEAVPLSEEQAVKRGSELLGEALVVGIGLGVLVHQVQRSDQLARIAQEQQQQQELETQAAFRAHVTAMEQRILARLEAIEKRLPPPSSRPAENGRRNRWWI